MRPYSAEQQIDHLDEYATGTSVKEIPGTTEYTNGVESGHTLPAKWWNWFISKMTSNVKKIAESVDDLYAEMLDVLSKNGVTPDPEETQLLSSLASLLHGDFIEKTASYSLLVTRPFVERLVVSNAAAIITLPNPATSLGYKGAHIYNISAGSISIQNHSSVEVYSLPPLALVYVTILNGVWKIYPFIKSSSNADSFTNVQRDEEGRAQIADPVEEEDIANKKTVMDYYRNDIIDAPCTLPVNKMLTVYNPDVAEIDPLILPDDVEIGNYIMLNVVTPCTIEVSTGKRILDIRDPENILYSETFDISDPASLRLQYNDEIYIKQSPITLRAIEDLIPSPGTQVDGITWSPDGRYLIASLNVSPYIAIYDWITGVPIKLANPSSLPTGRFYSGMAWSYNSRYLAIRQSTAPLLLVYDFQSGIPIKMADPAILPTNSTGLSFSSNGRLAVRSSSSPYVYIYEWIGGVITKMADPASLPGGSVGSLCWSPTGRYLVCSSNLYPRLTIYDFQSGSPIKITDPAILPTKDGTCLWSPDGQFLVVIGSISVTPYVLLYDWESGSPVSVSIVAGANYPSDGIWSTNGRFLITLAPNYPFIAIYDFQSGAPVKITHTVPGASTNSSLSYSWSLESRYLAESLEKTVYDFETIPPIKIDDPVPPLSTSNVTGTAWSPKGRFIAFKANTDNYLVLYDTYTKKDTWILI